MSRGSGRPLELAAIFTGVTAWLLAVVPFRGGSSSEAVMLLTAAAATLAAQVAFAMRVRGALGGLMLMLALYWAIGYVARPIVLLWLEPRPRIDDSLPDYRISVDYSAGISTVLEKAVPSFLLLLGIVLALQRLAGPTTSAPSRTRIRTDHLFVLMAIGWLARTYTFLFEGSPSLADIATRSTIVNTITILSAVAAGLILVTVDRLSPSLIIFLILSESAWALMSASKAPAMALLVFVTIRIFTRGERIRIGAAAAFVGLLLGLFLAVTRVKTAVGLLSPTESAQSRYPGLVQFFYPILDRFDAFKRNVDAAFAEPYSYFSAGEVFTRFWQTLLPQQILGGKLPSSGTSWGSTIVPQSEGSRSFASLAEGPVAEGWVLAGWVGILFEIVALAVAIIIVARLYQRARTTFAIAFAVSMTAQPYLFERGILGISEGAGKSLQLALIAALVMTLLGGSGRRGSPSKEFAGRNSSMWVSPSGVK